MQQCQVNFPSIFAPGYWSKWMVPEKWGGWTHDLSFISALTTRPRLLILTFCFLFLFCFNFNFVVKTTNTSLSVTFGFKSDLVSCWWKRQILLKKLFRKWHWNLSSAYCHHNWEWKKKTFVCLLNPVQLLEHF